MPAALGDSWSRRQAPPSNSLHATQVRGDLAAVLVLEADQANRGRRPSQRLSPLGDGHLSSRVLVRQKRLCRHIDFV